MAPAASAQPVRVQPKRKRNSVVKYYKTDSEDDSIDSDDDLSDAPPPKKQLKDSRKAVSNKPLPKHKIFPFNSLPNELKNKIYFLALTDSSGVFFVSKLKRYRRVVTREVPSHTDHDAGYRSRGRWSRSWSHAVYPPALDDSGQIITPPTLMPNLLVLNRQIYAETQPILYGANCFTVEDTTALHSFLSGIGPKNCGTLTDITIKGWGYSKSHKTMNHPALTLLSNALNLQHLSIDDRINWYNQPKKVANQLYRDGFHWLEALYAAKGEAAFDIIVVDEDNLSPQKWPYGSNSKDNKQPTAEELLAQFREELKKLVKAR